MGDVNTRIQDFFWKGKRQGQEEILEFMDLLADRYRGTQLSPGEDFSRVVTMLRNALALRMGLQETGQ